NVTTPVRTLAHTPEACAPTQPVSVRQLLDCRTPLEGEPLTLARTKTGEHDAPVYISSMSFGSQGETAYRAYAEAMARMDLLCINGEGGELPDPTGKSPRNRGQQLASGPFGVSALLATS